MTTVTSGRTLREFVESRGSKCGVGATDERIYEFERENNVQIPGDLRTYFIELNGTAGDYAYGIIRFWSIDECRTLEHEISAAIPGMAVIQATYGEPIEGYDQFFVFADYLHESQLYAIRLSSATQPNPIVMLDGGEPVVVADSFSDFVKRYLTAPEELRLEAD
jgi:hypothetical protein